MACCDHGISVGSGQTGHGILAVQELETHPLAVEDILDHRGHCIDLYNIDGYLWFLIQSTLRAEPSGRHCHTANRDHKQQDTVRRDLHQETERHNLAIGVNTQSYNNIKHRRLGHRDTEPQGC